jgi:hypothetical protein
MRDEIRKDIKEKLKKIEECTRIIRELTVKNSGESLDICEYCGEIKGLVDSISGTINMYKLVFLMDDEFIDIKKAKKGGKKMDEDKYNKTEKPEVISEITDKKWLESRIWDIRHCLRDIETIIARDVLNTLPADDEIFRTCEKIFKILDKILETIKK